MTTVNELFDAAMKLCHQGDWTKSLELLSKIISDYPHYDKRYAVYLLLGSIYRGQREYEEAGASYKEATFLNPKCELSSLGLYISYAESKKYRKAIRELIRYLRVYPAKLYKVTLEELLDGLKDGYMTSYKEEICELAKMNGVKSSFK